MPPMTVVSSLSTLARAQSTAWLLWRSWPAVHDIGKIPEKPPARPVARTVVAQKVDRPYFGVGIMPDGDPQVVGESVSRGPHPVRCRASPTEELGTDVTLHFQDFSFASQSAVIDETVRPRR